MTAATVDVWRFDSPPSGSDRAIDDALARWAGSGRTPPRHARDERRRPVVSDHPELSVSLAHSGGVTLVAIGERCRVGVDVEVVRDRGIAALPGHALCAVEREELDRRRDAWLQTLLSYWTRKEALLKAAGVGLAVEPNLIELPPPGETHVLALPTEFGRPERWSVCEIALGGHVAAVAADTQALDVRVHQAR
jgi:4'-phosphopantetheinyl transferase